MSDITSSDLESAEVPAQVDNRGKWYVMRALSSREDKLCEDLRAEILKNDKAGVYEAFVPTKKVYEVRDRKRSEKKKKLFPGYIFVRMDLYTDERDEDGNRCINAAAWFLVKSIRGIIGFVGNTKRPVPLSDKEVAGIIVRNRDEDEARPVPELKFAVGDKVVIFDGPFADHEGRVMEVDAERGMVKVLVSIFGRETPVDIGSWQVEKAD